jgi:hypothetical protein
VDLSTIVSLIGSTHSRPTSKGVAVESEAKLSFDCVDRAVFPENHRRPGFARDAVLASGDVNSVMSLAGRHSCVVA